MGNTDTKLNFRKAVIQLTTKTQPIEAKDDVFGINFGQKAVNKIFTLHFEESDWRGFFWSSLPGKASEETDSEGENMPLSQSLISALFDLLFCPDFTVSAGKKSGPDNPEDLQSIDSCEYIWEAGVGFAHTPSHIPQHDYNRTEILKLLLACFSQTMYMPASEVHLNPNKWIQYFTSADNRHALPLFTSLLNVVCAYDPVGYGVPFNHLLFTDSREPLVEVALQLLIVSLDHDFREPATDESSEKGLPSNLFINYLSRVHREEDFSFILKGFTRLLNNPLIQTYIPNSTKKKFMFYVLKSSEVLEVLVPILYHLNDARADQSRVGVVHIGVFILLLLSGERNFGVRLNKPYTASVPMDIPVFTGTHADLLIIVFHKIITTGHQRLQPLFDCLLTIVVNVSPYLKTLSMVASTKLLHLLEAFSTPWYLYTSPSNHHLVFFLLEIFNNIIQYQFDGNSNLVYTIIRKRNVFHSIANLPTDHSTIQKSLSKRNKLVPSTSTISLNSCTSGINNQSMEGSTPAKPAEKGTLNASLAATPCIDKMTERERAHPPSVPTSPTETSPPSLDSALEANSLAKTDNTFQQTSGLEPEGQEMITDANASKSESLYQEKVSPPLSPTLSVDSSGSEAASSVNNAFHRTRASSAASSVISVPMPGNWVPTSDWVVSWKQKLPLQTIMRLLQVLVPQVEKICIDKGLTDESEILKFLQHGTLVGLLPVPHPILIRKYQANSGTTMWFRTYMWGVIYLRNVDPPVWYDTDVKLFEIQRI
ncbi:protein HID1 [Caerostris extrusa]|uniref:Protein HID1 n=1 Tax=Caerostris extrusa TaxID=172846 RepID=A0AAV4Y9H1_CAEEX|nr:protein HID1 [Caerostris extrusa]